MPFDPALLLSFSQNLQRAGTIAELADATRRLVLQTSGLRTVWLASFEQAPDGLWVRILAASGSHESLIWARTPRFPVGCDPFLLEIRDSARPVVCEDARVDPRTDKAIVTEIGLRTCLNFPLLLGDQLVGALGVGSFGDEGVVTLRAAEIEQLSMFAVLLAAAFDRVRLLAEKNDAALEAQRLEAQRVSLEAQLLQAQKLEVVATLAGGIAHDFNNYLMVIRGYAQLLLRSVSAPYDREALEAILTAADRMTRLTRNLMIFSRKQAVTLRPLSLRSAIEATEPLLRPLLREDLDLDIQLPETDMVVSADEGALEQVLLNLATNARDAMSHGGRLTIRTSVVHNDADFVRDHGEKPLGRCALLEIVDTGQGMDAPTLERIFDPFFTTKGSARAPGSGSPCARGSSDASAATSRRRASPGMAPPSRSTSR